MKSQIHFTVRLHINRLGGLICTFARPHNNSIAAKAVFNSVFQLTISLVQTSDVACPNNPYAVSVNKIDIFIHVACCHLIQYICNKEQTL
jgi:hypothetical protein